MGYKSVVTRLRDQFPILDQHVNDHMLIYLDNGATTQKPQRVIDAICHYYQYDNANVHRSSHQLSQRTTSLFESARLKVRDFINAASEKEIIWTKGTTEGINLLANSFSHQLKKGDEVIISALDHHANIVPWQMLVDRLGIKLLIIPLSDNATLDLNAYSQLLCNKTKLVSITHVSNALGIINPIKQMIKMAHQVGAKVIVDGAQAIAHLPVDVNELGCDFYLFSAHKCFAATGLGVLYGKQALLEQLPPWQGGGEMIKSVSFEKTIYNELPFKFEAGTPNIAAVISLGEAIDFLNELDRDELQKHEQTLLAYLETELLKLNVRVFAQKVEKSGAISFVVKGEHHSDIAMMLDAQGIAVRSGSHCAMPLLKLLQTNGTVRVSVSIYNTMNEMNIFIDALKDIIEMLQE
jgi:cysteine desulfurase/selenocysteine lyase